MKERGCVVEVREKSLVLMTASCEFVEIPRRHGGVFPGMEVHFETQPRRAAYPARWVAVAAMLALLVIGSVVMTSPTSAMAVYTASIDINPSLDILMDEQGSVLEVLPMNEQASFLDTRRMKGNSIEEAVSSIVDQLLEQGYFHNQQHHYLVFSLRATDPDWPAEDLNRMKERLEMSIQEEKQEKAIDIEILAYAARKFELDAAEEEEVTLNHLMVKKQYEAMMKDRNYPKDEDENGRENSMETMVRSILKEKGHPVLDQHPGADPGGSKDRQEDDDPSIEREGKTHPIFEAHPGNNGRNNGGGPQGNQGDQGNR